MANKKDIEGYEGLYEIYEDGRVYSKYWNRFMKYKTDKDGYFMVGLTNKDKKRKHWKIHRLIAIHFIPNPENKPEVDHEDNNKQNNSIKNLRWATRQENACNRTINSNKKQGKYVGITPHGNKWEARVQIEGNRETIGFYDDEEVAYEERKKFIHKNYPEKYKYLYKDRDEL